MQSVSDDIESLQVDTELRTCPGCGYARGFHVSFISDISEDDGKHHRLVLICPDCGARYDVGKAL
jgi:ribosomal protein S27AE